MPDDSTALLTRTEVADQLRIHPRTVMRFVKAGKLKAVRIGRLVRFRPEDVNELLGDR